MRKDSKRKHSKPNRLQQLEVLERRNLLAADLVSISPAPDSAFVNPAEDFVLEFDEPVSVGTGDITISANGEVVETIDVTDASQVTIDGSTVTIDPASDLPADSAISVQVGEGAIAFQSVTLFSEGFEDVPMEGFFSESEIEGGDSDWSEEIPDGWDLDNTTTPDGGPPEFFGWVIQNKDRWIETAGDQSRSEFTLGNGNVFVADGDEYDDGGWGGIGPNQMNTFLRTPEISLDGVGAGEAVLEFSSSFRPEVDQTALVEVSYDGGTTWTELMRINETNVDGGRSSLARANVREKFALDNPENGSVWARFGYIDAGNNWWWAIDDVAVEVPGEGESSAATEWSFNTAVALSPAQAAVGVSVDSNLTITFGQDVVLTPGLGNVNIHQADGTLFESIPVAGDRVTSAGPVVTIDPVNDLEPNTEYSVTIDDFTIWDTANVDVSGITLFSEDFESLALEDSGLVGGLDINHYVVVMEGVLNVTEAGVYTFGVNTDDGSRLAIDLDQNGLDLLNDEVIFDDSTHGSEDRLTTCFLFDDTVTSCPGDGEPGFDLAVGEYAFEFWYFEATGGSSGEFFYSKGTQEAFDADTFALVGDDSQGIGVTADGITATVYVSALEEQSLDEINSFDRAEALVDGDIVQTDGFPASTQIPTADMWNTGGGGRFRDNHPLPGFEPPEPEFDWAPEGPEGWTKDTSFLEENRPGGPAEYFGWNFLQKDFWIAEQGDQNRSEFELGENVLALVDPDAYDDFVDIDGDTGSCAALPAGDRTAGAECGWFTGGLSTPPINLEGLDPNSASVSFDSSWWDEDTQSAEVTVEFFDAEGNSISSRQLLRWESIASDPNYKGVARNETVTLELQNPAGAASAVVTFSMPYGQNDWWWAIDNVRLTSPFSGNPLPGVDAGQWTFTTGEGGGETLVGDINGNGTVDFADFLILSGNFGKTLGDGGAAAAEAATDLVFAAAAEDDGDDDDTGLSLDV